MSTDSTSTSLPLDLLAVGAHPDDCELFAAGLLYQSARRGRRVGVCDLTRGEAASRGTPEERADSARKAAEILGLSERVILDCGDAGLENNAANRAALVGVLRRFRPRVVLTFHPDDRHPDHPRAHHLVRECCFYATVGNFAAEGERLEHPPALIYFFGNTGTPAADADFIVPMDEETWAKKREALAAYESQFFNDEAGDGPKTYISSPEFAEVVEARHKLWGRAAGAPYGEPYRFDRPPAVADPLSFMLKPS